MLPVLPGGLSDPVWVLGAEGSKATKLQNASEKTGSFRCHTQRERLTVTLTRTQAKGASHGTHRSLSPKQQPRVYQLSVLGCVSGHRLQSKVFVEFYSFLYYTILFPLICDNIL